MLYWRYKEMTRAVRSANINEWHRIAMWRGTEQTPESEKARTWYSELFLASDPSTGMVLR